MQYRRLGHSGVQVSLLSFGSWVTFGNQISDDVAQDLMVLAYDSGVNFFDNAEAYAQGKSELVMGKILKTMQWPRSSYMVSSKVYFGDEQNQKPNQTGLSRKHVTEACHAALKRLNVDYLDLYFCHRPDKNTPVEETVWTMHNLICAGKVLYWGTSEWSAQEIMEAHMVAQRYHLIGPTMEQPQYNMFHRKRVEVEYSQIYKHPGLGTTIWSPLASGTLTQKYIDDFPEDSRLNMESLQWIRSTVLTRERLEKIQNLHALARELNTTLPKLAVAWCANNPHVSTVILGASRRSQLEETLQSLDTMPLLTPEVETRIETILDNKPNPPAF